MPEVLENLVNHKEVLLELKNKLKNDGLIFGSILNGFGLTEIVKFVIHRFLIYDFLKFFYLYFKRKKLKKRISFNCYSGHIYFFTFPRFKRWLSSVS